MHASYSSRIAVAIAIVVDGHVGDAQERAEGGRPYPLGEPRACACADNHRAQASLDAEDGLEVRVLGVERRERAGIAALVEERRAVDLRSDLELILGDDERGAPAEGHVGADLGSSERRRLLDHHAAVQTPEHRPETAAEQEAGIAANGP